MILTSLTSYKSVPLHPITELPNLTIITGENGAGKTHLLNAIRERAILVDDIEQQQIRFYTWGNMIPSNEQGLIPRGMRAPGYEKMFVRYSLGIFEDLAIILNDNNLALPYPVEKEHLLAYTFKNDFYNQLPEKFQILLESTIENYKTCLREGLLRAISNNRDYHIVYRSLEVQEEFDLKRNEPNNHVLNADECKMALNILDNVPDFFNLDEKHYLNVYPMVYDKVDPFQGSLSKLFAVYINEKEVNDLNRLRHERKEIDGFLTNEEFLKKFGPPPWEIIDEVLRQADIPFRIKRPDLDAGSRLDIRLIHRESGAILDFSDLSSGERILLSFAQFLFLSDYNRQPLEMPELILLDEVDAPLHPSMVAAMLRIIVEVLVKRHGLRVIMVTHSPSTVALAPEESLFVLDRQTKRLRKTSHDEAIHTLTAGVPVLSVRLENQRQIFVESEYDAACYSRISELVKRLLHPELSFVFIPSGTKGGGSCDRVKDLVNKLSEGGNHTVFGIVDWDLTYNGNNRVHVLGRGQRYSIENYLFDPIALAVLLYQMRLIKPEALRLEEGQTFADLRTFDNTRLQEVVNNVLHHLGLPTSQQPTRLCAYLNGCSVQVPIAYLEMQGHALEGLIKSTAPEFGRFRNDGMLKLELIDKVYSEMPGFISTDFVDLLRGIQTS